MVRTTTSPIWGYFVKVVATPHMAECNTCKGNVSRGSKNPKHMTNTNMKNHLRQKHGDLYISFLKTDQENNEEKKRVAEEEGDEAGPFNLGNKKQKTDFLQQTVPDMMTVEPWKMKDPRNVTCHKAVLKMVIWDLQPYSMVNQGGFLTLVKTLNRKFNPGTDKFYRDMMLKTYQKCKEQMMNILNDINPDNVALVLDGWSQFHHGYVGVNAHFIDDGWKRKKFNLGCIQLDTSHTGQAMADLTQTLAEEWQIANKVFFVVRDGASNMVRMGDLLHWGHGDCANHTLQLTIQDELLGLPSVETVVDKCRKVCTYNNKTVLLSSAIMAAQEPLQEGEVAKQLVQDVRTRWNSTFDMLKRFLELKTAIVKVLAEEEWADKLEVSFYNTDWELIAKCVNILNVFKEATLMLSSSDASISQVIPIVKLIHDSLAVNRRNDRGVITLKRNLSEALSRRFAIKEDLEKYAVATLLDPRYKKLFFQDDEKCDDAVKTLLALLKEEARNDADILVPNEQPVDNVDDETGAAGEKEFSIKTLMETTVNASLRAHAEAAENTEEDILGKYLNSPVEEKVCLKFWRDYEQNCQGNPVKKALARLAKKFLTAPPTSTDVERLFSVAGNILCDERNRLLPSNAASLLFMRENITNYNYQL